MYNYRLFDRYKKPIVSLAVLADGQSKWRPSFYEHNLWGCQTRFEFVCIKLLDYEVRRKSLIESTNPFATVILAHIASLKTRQDEQTRLSVKLNLTRSLYSKGWDRTAIIDLYTFIDWVIALPEPLELQYIKEIERFEEEKQMAYITSAERIGIQKGEKIALLRQIQKNLVRCQISTRSK